MTRVGLSVALLAAAAAGPGCQTAVGHYFAERARDFGECWRVQVGTGYGLGMGGRAFGVLAGGLGIGAWRSGTTIGFSYGDLYPRTGDGDDYGDIELAVVVMAIRYSGPVLDWKPALLCFGGPSPVEDAEDGEWTFGIPPALLTWIGPGPPTWSMGVNPAPPPPDRPPPKPARWLWHTPTIRGPGGTFLPRTRTHAQLHAFDCEAWAFAGFVGARVGFSPGEFLDFVLGWFGTDIAGDDRPWKPDGGRAPGTR